MATRPIRDSGEQTALCVAHVVFARSASIPAAAAATDRPRNLPSPHSRPQPGSRARAAATPDVAKRACDDCNRTISRMRDSRELVTDVFIRPCFIIAESLIMIDNILA